MSSELAGPAEPGGAAARKAPASATQPRRCQGSGGAGGIATLSGLSASGANVTINATLTGGAGGSGSTGGAGGSLSFLTNNGNGSVTAFTVGGTALDIMSINVTLTGGNGGNGVNFPAGRWWRCRFRIPILFDQQSSNRQRAQPGLRRHRRQCEKRRGRSRGNRFHVHRCNRQWKWPRHGHLPRE